MTTRRLIHPPRIHRHRYHGVLAPNAKLRYQVIALEPEQGTAQESPSGQLDTQAVTGSSDGATPGCRTSSRWAALIARIYDVLPLACPSCGASMSIIAFITDPVPLHAILSYLDLATRPLHCLRLGRRPRASSRSIRPVGSTPPIQNPLPNSNSISRSQTESTPHAFVPLA